MSFYGNITSNNKTQFKFEKKYATEVAMNAAAAEDGVFVGGYVLVDDEDNPTVWQKIQTADLQFKYVMIAELNSVVPTFDIITDAPTEKPQAPYFNADSTNMHYKLHIQPSWGLRVAEAGEGEPSDIEAEGKHLDIYFNKAGFDKTTRTISPSEDNQIVLTNAKSGQQYNGVEGNDIKELRIHLPAIGNTVAEMHDLMYGENRQSGPDSLQGQLNFFTTELQSNQIPIYTTKEVGLKGSYLEGLKLTQLVNEDAEKDIIKTQDSLNDALLSINRAVNGINANLDKLTEDLGTVNNKIVQADWNESNIEKESFIRNKPINIVTEKTTWEYHDNGHQFDTWPESESFTLETLFVKVYRLEKYIRALADKIDGINLDDLDKEEENNE